MMELVYANAVPILVGSIIFVFLFMLLFDRD